MDPAPPRPEIKALDAALQAATTPAAIVAGGRGARESAGRSGAVLHRRAAADRSAATTTSAIALAERGAAVSDRFVDENLSAYQMTGKSQGSKARGHATAADLVGWAQFMKKNYAAAAEKLGEAERLSQGLDFVNQFHLGELARAQNAPARARDHYLDALSLARRPGAAAPEGEGGAGALQAGARPPAGSTRGSRRS